MEVSNERESEQETSDPWEERANLWRELGVIHAPTWKSLRPRRGECAHYS
jgi:hypothetical protein